MSRDTCESCRWFERTDHRYATGEGRLVMALLGYFVLWYVGLSLLSDASRAAQASDVLWLAWVFWLAAAAWVLSAVWVVTKAFVLSLRDLGQQYSERIEPPSHPLRRVEP